MFQIGSRFNPNARGVGIVPLWGFKWEDEGPFLEIFPSYRSSGFYNVLLT